MKNIILIGCFIYSSIQVFGQEKSEQNLEKWTVFSLNDKEVPAQLIYFSYDPATSTLFGKSACNNFNGKLEINTKKNTLKTGNFISTMMLCQGDKMQWEKEFIETISNQKKIKYKYENRTIVVLNKNKKIMVLHPYNESAPAGVLDASYLKYMQENKWKLIQMDGKQMDAGILADLHFTSAELKASGTSGCNRYFGEYKIEGNTIHFSKIGTTKMACEENKMKIEKRFLEILNTDAIRFDIADQTLNFYIKDTLVLMFGIEK